MRKEVYLNKEELSFVNKQPKGYLRGLVQDVMRGRETVSRLPHKQELMGSTPILATKKGDGLKTCKQCGAMLPYYKGRCKSC
jgi:hypothetical protein